ncbi:MAG: flippase-like domain-containing protein [Candidatus Bathyarchaeota archaeon]|nr:flippase-like domain-containing protein [Candidatus Bathyarchaeota archaeon]
MSSANYLSARKSIFFMIAGLIAFGFYLYFFVGIGQLVSVIEKINTTKYLLFYAFAICTLLLALLCWTASWKTILQTLSVNLSMKKAFVIFWIGYFVDLVIPSQTVGSELTRLYLVRNETEGDAGAIAASAVTNRIVEYFIVTTGLFTSVTVVMLMGNVPTLVSGFLITVLIGALVYLVVLLFLALRERAAEVLVSGGIRIMRALRVKRFSSDSAAEKAKLSLAVFYQSFQIFRQNPKYLLKPLVFQLLSFLLSLAVYLLVFVALGFRNLSFEFFILVFFISTAVQASTGGFSVGSLDIILVAVFYFYGIPEATSGVAVVALRSVTYWIPLLIGYVMVQVLGLRNILEVRSKANAAPLILTPA